MRNLRLPVEEQRKLQDGEVWKSLSRGQNGYGDQNETQRERGFEKAVVEQWGWLYCPEDLVRELEDT